MRGPESPEMITGVSFSSSDFQVPENMGIYCLHYSRTTTKTTVPNLRGEDLGHTYHETKGAASFIKNRKSRYLLAVSIVHCKLFIFYRHQP